MLFLLKFAVVHYGRSVRLLYTWDNFLWYLEPFKPPFLYSYYPLWNHFEPPDEIFFLY